MNAKAIAVGFLVDLLGSVAVGILLGVVMAVLAFVRGITSPDALVALAANVYIKAVGLAGTTLATAFGGYVAARMSAPRGLRNALAVGVLSLILGLALALAAPGITPRWKLIAGAVLTVPAAYLGGWLATRTACSSVAGKWAEPATPA